MEAIKIFIYVVIIIISISAIKTLIPYASASKPCLLGYKATCSFTPISTIILLAVAVAVFFVSRNILAS
jgi:hypothetical protein